MESNKYAAQNGSASNGAAKAKTEPAKRRMPPTVDQALPYSPFSSVIPFNPDIIPVPTVGLRSSTSLFLNADERDEARQDLESLNRETTNQSQTSQRLEQTLQDLKHLLQPQNLAHFKFKTGPRATTKPEPKYQSKMSLTPFSKMVYDATDVAFTYPTPQPASPSRVKKAKAPSQDQKSPLQTKSKSKLAHDGRPSSVGSQKSYENNSSINTNHTAYEDNSTITVDTSFRKESNSKAFSHSIAPTKSASKKAHQSQILSPQEPSHKPSASQTTTPRQPSARFAVVIPAVRRDDQPMSQPQLQPAIPAVKTPQRLHSSEYSIPSSQASIKQSTPQVNPSLIPSSSNPNLSVVIPGPPPTFRPEEYEMLPDSPSTPQNFSRKRKRSSDGYDGEILLTYDQRQQADLAVKNLNGYLQDIFDAEDQLQPDSIASNNFLTSSGDGIALTNVTQSKVDGLLQKVIKFGRYPQISLEDLLRLQKLSDFALRDSENINVKVDDAMGESEVGHMFQNLSIAELGLRSARTSLRLMSGGRDNKQLYSEDVIQSALYTLKNVTETCIIPIVEMRNSGTTPLLFKSLTAQKKAILGLLELCRRVLSLMATLVSKINLSETVINTLEFMASRLIFVENAQTEKDSILGIAKFDSFRVVAMDVLAQIFLRNPAQRQGIFSEILTSLEKLPVTKQSARQFKLADGGSIQLVSALIMRLIQTSASKAEDPNDKRKKQALGIGGEEDEEQTNGNEKARPTIISEERAEQQVVTAIQELGYVTSPLLEAAQQDALYVVSFIVTRALNSTKSGDAPYRNLLDLFVQDFITCLNSTDWPAAELLLRLLLFKMVHLVDGDKTPAPAKNMALDLLGSMGAAISELQSHVKKSANTLENSDAELGKWMARLAEVAIDKKASPSAMVSWACGPYRTSLEFLEHRCASEDPQLSSAIAYFVAQWGAKIVSTYDKLDDDQDGSPEIEREYGRLAYRLRMMITDKRWLTTEYSFDSVAPTHARLAYSITLLNSQFCGSFGRVLQILLGSMTSDQATVRSKSMKSVNQVLETDPSILDREPAVKHLLLRCSNDPSILVRDSALGLIGKCISLRPALEGEMFVSILARVNDNGVGVRKRAIKLCKDIYLRNTDNGVRSSIADQLLHRVQDTDEGVQELARQTIEDIWMSPFYTSPSISASTTEYKLAMADHVALIVTTVKRSGGVGDVLDKVLKNILSPNSKQASANYKVCKALVATMFETIIDNSENDAQNAPSAQDTLQILKIFAQSDAKLFTPEQVQLLEPYIKNVGNDDLTRFVDVVIIFRHVLPVLSKIHNNFLVSVRNALVPLIGRPKGKILDDMIACLWAISSSLSDFHHLTRVTLSSLKAAQGMQRANLSSDQNRIKICKLLSIIGVCGKHCNFDPQIDQFKKDFPNYRKDSTSMLMVDTVVPFTAPEQPGEVRKAAFEAVGNICQSWPKNFESVKVYTAFEVVFKEEVSSLEIIIMRAFKDFLVAEEKRSEASKDIVVASVADANAVAASNAKLAVMGGSQGDGSALAIARRFLADLTRIALETQDEKAFLATEILASISKQGLIHPKECGATLIALETSQNPRIAELAFDTHRLLHEKHETILEKEYMKAVELAYNYQRDVAKDHHGANLDPFASKLHKMIEVLKISKVKNRKRFFESLCERIDRDDPLKMSLQELPHHLEFSQFIIENMAFFEYTTVDELLGAVSAMEKVVAGAGTGVAHAIETEIFHISLDQPVQTDENGQVQSVEQVTDSSRLLQLTASSMMLSCLWEARSYLRRQYALKSFRIEGKGKGDAAKLNKTPIKIPSINGDKFWEFVSSTFSSLESEESMKTQCKAFVELLSVDQEFKVAQEGDDDMDTRLTTPSDDEDNDGPAVPGSGRGRKRKSTSTPGGRKKRARSSSITRGRGKLKSSGKRASIDREDDE
ncbi:AT hook domain-containing protein [Bisporella sp. PMI_857]|nr:AT hook domain-containing protein [Bisporella sp. PMI_857]